MYLIKRSVTAVMLISGVATLCFFGCKKDLKTTPASLSTSRVNKSNNDSLVLTPSGLLPKSHIFLIENGYSLMVKNGSVQKVKTETGKVIEDLGTIQTARQSSVLQTNSIKEGIKNTNSVGAVGSAINWQAYSEWHNTSGNPISYFSTNWVVPSTPYNSSNGQTFFIFNALQPAELSAEIIQPVLQWGASAAGGGNYWGIANWYYWKDVNNNLFYAISQLLTVTPGTNLTGIISKTGQAPDGSPIYQSSFSGYSNSLHIQNGDHYGSVTVSNVSLESWAFETLEAYNSSGINNGYDVSQAWDYPADPNVKMKNIQLLTNGSPATMTWIPQYGPNAYFGERTNVISSNASGSGEVDLYFHPTINNQLNYSWNNGNGSGSGTINASPGTLVHVTVAAYGPGTLTNFTMSGAQLSGPMGSSIYIQNNYTTQTFTMPSSGQVTWNGYFQRSGSSGTGSISLY